MTGKKLPPVRTALTGDGDFRSLECEGLLDGCDVVVTNPPFSLFREFIAQLTAYGKPFIVVGNMNEVICREIFPLVRDGKLWLGHTHPTRFLRPDGTEKPFGNVVWCTNVDMPGRHGPLGLTERYADDPSRYPRYDNYDAIDVGRVADIPMDWDGVMGVPVSFLGRHCPEQFDIVWQAAGNTRACAPPEVLRELGYVPHPEDRGGCGVVDGRRKYVRILVRRRPDA